MTYFVMSLFWTYWFCEIIKFAVFLQAPPGPIPPDKDVIPLCCCKINGACFKKLGSSVTYCQALDSVDGKVRL